MLSHILLHAQLHSSTAVCAHTEIYEHSSRRAALVGFSFCNVVGDKLDRRSGIKAFLSSLFGKGNLLAAPSTGIENPQKDTGLHKKYGGKQFLWSWRVATILYVSGQASKASTSDFPHWDDRSPFMLIFIWQWLLLGMTTCLQMGTTNGDDNLLHCLFYNLTCLGKLMSHGNVAARARKNTYIKCSYDLPMTPFLSLF